MAELNEVSLIGNITQDLNDKSFGYVGNGYARANITIAVNRSRKQGEEWIKEVSYFDVTVWGKDAENNKALFTKGRKVLVTGYLKQERWEKDGQKHSKVGIQANGIWFLNGKENKPDTSPAAEPVEEEISEDIPF